MSDQPEIHKLARRTRALRRWAIIGAVLALASPILYYCLIGVVIYLPAHGDVARFVQFDSLPFSLATCLGAIVCIVVGFLSAPGSKLRMSMTLLVGGVVLYSILFPDCCPRRNVPRMNNCIATQKEISTAIMLYVQEHGGALPQTADFWKAEATPVKSTKCIGAPSRANGYIANGPICGKTLAAITDPAHTFLTADGQADDEKLPNIGRYYEDFNAGRHRYKGKGYVVASFLDGHVDIAVPIANDPHWLPRKGTP